MGYQTGCGRAGAHTPLLVRLVRAVMSALVVSTQPRPGSPSSLPAPLPRCVFLWNAQDPVPTTAQLHRLRMSAQCMNGVLRQDQQVVQPL